MDCPKPIIIRTDSNPNGLLVGCGKCALCRIQKRREWSMRMVHERGYHDSCMFLTLTYNDENLPYHYPETANNRPVYPTLEREALQKFFKRLRKQLPTDKKIKYFACGEYGPKNQRPHYHAIIFGLDPLSKFDRELIKSAWQLCDWSKEIEEGSFGFVSGASIDYVSQYVAKKHSGKKADDLYKALNRENVFSLKSNGIGKQFALDNKKYLYQQKLTYNGSPVSIPRYYIKLLDLPPEPRILKSFEEECALVKSITGYDMTIEELRKKDYSQYKKYTQKKCNSARQKLREYHTKQEHINNKKL